MTLHEKIRARLDAEHPEIFASVQGEQRLVTGVEREELLDAWASEAVNVGFTQIREQRDALLAASDWTQAADAPVDAAAWAKYRQALRDLPAKIKDPTAEVNWPEPPK